MVWQESFSPTGGPAFDAERERERKLAAQARSGATWALTALIARYQPTVVRYLTRLCGSQEHAHVMAERIFQRMERRLHGPQGGDNLRLWLLRASTEAGLDALRHPHNQPAPRLAGSAVAGLLAQEASKEPRRGLFDSVRWRRNGAHGVDRQAHPLVWGNAHSATEPDGHAGATSGASQDFIDEGLDRLNPRDALRHRLVRVTLAELPYGDAQCLALHLVAGLNQAEVAKALDITNSAARKRIVHGLALFSDRYGQAVQSLGLPDEIGFGEAAARAPMLEPEPVAAPSPEPVVVPSEAPAPGQFSDPLDDEYEPDEEGASVLSGVSYVTDDSIELQAIAHEEAEPVPAYVDADPVPAYASGVRTPLVSISMDEDTLAAVAASDDLAGATAAGQITRLANDAIIGPVVDALPISTSSANWRIPTGGPAIEQWSSHTTPLEYELDSSAHAGPTAPQPSWLDDAGAATPLSFEAVATSTGPLSSQAGRLDHHESAPLGYEAIVSPHVDATSPAHAEEPLTLEPLPTAQTPQPTPEPAHVPILSMPYRAPEAEDDEPEIVAPPEFKVTSRSLEDVWNELADELDW